MVGDRPHLTPRCYHVLRRVNIAGIPLSDYPLEHVRGHHHVEGLNAEAVCDEIAQGGESRVFAGLRVLAELPHVVEVCLLHGDAVSHLLGLCQRVRPRKVLQRQVQSAATHSGVVPPTFPVLAHRRRRAAPAFAVVVGQQLIKWLVHVVHQPGCNVVVDPARAEVILGLRIHADCLAPVVVLEALCDGLGVVSGHLPGPGIDRVVCSDADVRDLRRPPFDELLRCVRPLDEGRGDPDDDVLPPLDIRRRRRATIRIEGYELVREVALDGLSRSVSEHEGIIRGAALGTASLTPTEAAAIIGRQRHHHLLRMILEMGAGILNGSADDLRISRADLPLVGALPCDLGEVLGVLGEELFVASADDSVVGVAYRSVHRPGHPVPPLPRLIFLALLFWQAGDCGADVAMGEGRLEGPVRSRHSHRPHLRHMLARFARHEPAHAEEVEEVIGGIQRAHVRAP